MDNSKGRLSNLLRWYQGKRNIFNSINLETYAFCNRKCEFCFNHDSFPKRDQGIMDDETFFHVVRQLKKIRYAGRVSPILYGEPLLDKRMSEFVKHLRSELKYADIVLNTNGDYLSEELLGVLIRNGLNKIYVTNYDNDEKPNLQKLSEKYSSYVIYRNMKDKNIVNRAGALIDRKSNVQNIPCHRPKHQLVINWNGDVILCCNDYYGKYVFGNVREVSIMQAWNNIKFLDIKQTLSEAGGRKKIELCKNCDM